MILRILDCYLDGGWLFRSVGACCALAAAILISCSGKPVAPALAGDQMCIQFTDSGAAQATVNAGGIAIVIPLSMRRLDGGAE
jgi:hypothetical protein